MCLFNTIAYIDIIDIFIYDEEESERNEVIQKITAANCCRMQWALPIDSFLLPYSMKLKSKERFPLFTHWLPTNISPDKSIPHTTTQNGKQHRNRFESFIFSSFNVMNVCVCVCVSHFLYVFSLFDTHRKERWNDIKSLIHKILLGYLYVSAFVGILPRKHYNNTVSE